MSPEAREDLRVVAWASRLHARVVWNELKQPAAAIALSLLVAVVSCFALAGLLLDPDQTITPTLGFVGGLLFTMVGAMASGADGQSWGSLPIRPRALIAFVEARRIACAVIVGSVLTLTCASITRHLASTFAGMALLVVVIAALPWLVRVPWLVFVGLLLLFALLAWDARLQSGVADRVIAGLGARAGWLLLADVVIVPGLVVASANDVLGAHREPKPSESGVIERRAGRALSPPMHVPWVGGAGPMIRPLLALAKPLVVLIGIVFAIVLLFVFATREDAGLSVAGLGAFAVPMLVLGILPVAEGAAVRRWIATWPFTVRRRTAARIGATLAFCVPAVAREAAACLALGWLDLTTAAATLIASTGWIACCACLDARSSRIAWAAASIGALVALSGVMDADNHPGHPWMTIAIVAIASFAGPPLLLLTAGRR